MGDSRRFDLFAKLIKKHIPIDYKIADVSAGKGYLQIALKEQGYKNITSFDKRNKKSRRVSTGKNYKYRYFSYNIEDKFDVVVAMHPDEGTDHAIMYGIKNRVPVIVCPCCIKPSATAAEFSRKNANQKNWLSHLKSIGERNNMTVIETVLTPMTGKRLVLIFKPK